MSRYYALVLVPGQPSVEEACDIAEDLLYPYMHDPDDPDKPFHFDYMYSPDNIAALTDDEVTQHMWPVSGILDQVPLAELQVEAVLAPDGICHEQEPGLLWDNEPWLQEVRRTLEEHRGCLALRYVLHI